VQGHGIIPYMLPLAKIVGIRSFISPINVMGIWSASSQEVCSFPFYVKWMAGIPLFGGSSLGGNWLWQQAVIRYVGNTDVGHSDVVCGPLEEYLRHPKAIESGSREVYVW
jgi:hypothetical protein